MNNDHINNSLNQMNVMMKTSTDSTQETDAIIMHQAGKTKVLKKQNGMQVIFQHNTDDGMGRLMAGINLTGLIDSQYNIN